MGSNPIQRVFFFSLLFMPRRPSPIAACALAVRCHRSLAVALDAISYTASLGNGQEAMRKWFVLAAFKVRSYAGLFRHIAGQQLPIAHDSHVVLCR